MAAAAAAAAALSFSAPKSRDSSRICSSILISSPASVQDLRALALSKGPCCMCEWIGMPFGFVRKPLLFGCPAISGYHVPSAVHDHRP